MSVCLLSCSRATLLLLVALLDRSKRTKSDVTGEGNGENHVCHTRNITTFETYIVPFLIRYKALHKETDKSKREAVFMVLVLEIGVRLL